MPSSSKKAIRVLQLSNINNGLDEGEEAKNKSRPDKRVFDKEKTNLGIEVKSVLGEVAMSLKMALENILSSLAVIGYITCQASPSARIVVLS